MVDDIAEHWATLVHTGDNQSIRLTNRVTAIWIKIEGRRRPEKEDDIKRTEGAHETDFKAYVAFRYRIVIRRLNGTNEKATIGQ